MSNPLKDSIGHGTTFKLFMSNLKKGDNAAWEQLWQHFREKVIPYIRKNLGTLPSNAVVSPEYVTEEIFAESLFKFYELFEKGEFEDEGQLRGLMFRITDLKLKEIRRKVIKDSQFFFPETSKLSEKEGDNFLALSEKEEEQFKIIRLLEAALTELQPIDREILIRFATGERLKNIAEDLNLNEAGCRKKKQRSLDKLRSLLPPFSKIGIVVLSMFFV